MSMLERILENGEKLLIPNDVELTGQFTATGLQSEPGGIAYYVHNGTGKNDYDGKSAAFPAPSITKALTFCRASKGDTIHCLPGHIETISAAGGLTFSKAGVRVFFHGRGNTKATIQFTATAATLLVTAANVELYSPRFLTGIDAIVAAINPQAADLKIYNAEYYDAAAKATLHAIVATSAADRLKIDGWKYVVSTTGTQKHSNIQLAGGDHIELKNIEIEGNFNVAPVESTAALTNVLLENIYANNVNGGPLPALNLHADSTGFAKNVKCRVASGTAYVTSVAKIQWGDDCEGFNTDGYGGEPIGTPIATGIEGKLDSVLSDIIDVWSDVKSVISDLTGDVWSDLKSVISDLVDVVSDLTDIRSDIVTVQSDLGDLKSDMLITHSDVKVVISDLKVLDAIGDTIKSDLIISHSDIKMINARSIVLNSDMLITHSDVKSMNTRTITIASDLVITQSDVKDISGDVNNVKSDLIITQSDIKSMNTRQITIASDLVIVQSDVRDVGSDLLDIRSDIVVVQSDLGDVWSDIVIIQSDVKVIDARVKVTNSDMIITHSDVKVIISDLNDLRSDMLITHSDVKTINSDLIVADALIDTIKSDLIISQSDLKIVDRNKDYIATVDLAAANMTGTVTRFTIANGPILVKHLGAIVTTNIPAGVNTLLFSFIPTGQIAANLCGATETASANTPQLFTVDGVKVTVLQKVTDFGIMVAANETAMPLILSEGVIQTVFSAGPPATGAMKLYMQYQKLNPTATVT